MYHYIKGKGWILAPDTYIVTTGAGKSWKVYDRRPVGGECAIGCTIGSEVERELLSTRGEVDFMGVADLYVKYRLSFGNSPHIYDYVYVVEAV